MTVTGADDTIDLVVNDGSSAPGLDVFHTLEFQALHQSVAHRTFSCAFRRRRSHAILGVAHFHESSEGRFESPWRGSFGGFAMAPGVRLPPSQLDGLVSAVESYLRDAGAKDLTLILPPLVYHPDETSVWINVLLRAGFSIRACELNQAIAITGAFTDRLDAGNRKQIAKAIRARLTCRPLAPEEYHLAYAVIEANRHKKGHQLSMSWAALWSMCEALPACVRCFGVHRDDGALIAAAICLRINPSVLYVFYWGEIGGVESLSPVTLLANHVYNYCVDERIALLDLGTSTLNGVPNEGLIRYKRHLGAGESLKLTLHKALT